MFHLCGNAPQHNAKLVVPFGFIWTLISDCTLLTSSFLVFPCVWGIYANQLQPTRIVEKRPGPNPNQPQPQPHHLAMVWAPERCCGPPQTCDQFGRNCGASGEKMSDSQWLWWYTLTDHGITNRSRAVWMGQVFQVCVPTLHFVCDEKQVVPANRILGKVRKLLGMM